MYRSNMKKRSRVNPSRLLLLMASCLLFTACQSTPYLPETADSEIEQPQVTEPRPETEQPQPNQPEPQEPEPAPTPETDPESPPGKPTITSVEPAIALPGDVVMVLGEGFGKQPGELRAKDGRTIPIVYWSDGRIDFRVTSPSLPIRIIPLQPDGEEVHVELSDEHLVITEKPAVEHVLVSTDVTTIDLHSIVTIRFAVQAVDAAGNASSPDAVDWQLSDAAVAELTPTGREHRYVIGDTWYEELSVHALQVGPFEVTATAAGNTASVALNVQDYVTGLLLQPTGLALDMGSDPEASVTAALGLASGATSTAGYVSWSSSDTRVATVENGMVTAIAAGKAVITAFANGFQASIEVGVTDPLVQLNLTGGLTDLKLGDSRQLQVERVLASGAVLPAAANTIWTSSNSDAISVTDNGLITAHTPGTATIRASVGEVTAELTFTAIDHVTAITIHRLNGTQIDQLIISGMNNMIFPTEVTARLHYYSGAVKQTTTELEWESTAPQTARMESRANYTIVTPGNKVASAILYATHPESGTRTYLIAHVIWPVANN